MRKATCARRFSTISCGNVDQADDTESSLMSIV
jgi:hypothetical protein